MNLKSQLNSQILIYIMMGLIFIFILIFGVNKFFFTKTIISEIEFETISNKLIEGFSKCDDPLNSGAQSSYILKNKNYDAICLLGKKQILPSGSFFQFDDLTNIYRSGDNLVFIKSDLIFNSSLNKYEFNKSSFNVVDSKKILIGNLPDTICWNDENSNNLELIISCK